MYDCAISENNNNQYIGVMTFSTGPTLESPKAPTAVYLLYAGYDCNTGAAVHSSA